MINLHSDAVIDYERVTGVRLDEFVCPVTGHHCEHSEVIRGHILNKAIKDAPRKTIPSYSAIDNFYGASVESDLTGYSNARTWTKTDLLSHSHEVFVVDDKNALWKIFPISKKSMRGGKGPPFPSFDLILNDGRKRVPCFVKMSPVEFSRLDHESIEIEGHFVIRNLAIVGALLKAAHCTLFHTMGYQWVLHDLGGIEISRVLREFYERGIEGKNDLSIFEPYRGCVKVLAKADRSRVPDSVSDSQFLLHMHPRLKTLWYAISILLPINGFVFSVTVPTCDTITLAIERRTRYQLLIENPDVPKNAHWLMFDKDHWKLTEEPQSLLAPDEHALAKIRSYVAAEGRAGAECPP